ncbi:MAG: hypothetical protein KJO08_06625 [Gammaproteobacteria bacterium]|nr:hypothetical protein [Gammaproteobacteria bacterium]NNJ84751.1 hypothetical protein [Gammaproteobacteria bacterium]
MHERVLSRIDKRLNQVIDIPTEDGWDKLCPFLALPTPGLDFPHQNRSRDMATNA